MAFVIIAALSIWAVTSQNKAFSFKSFTEYVRNANPYYMTAAVLSAETPEPLDWKGFQLPAADPAAGYFCKNFW